MTDQRPKASTECIEGTRTRIENAHVHFARVNYEPAGPSFR